jgi:tetratricopeptide (TPR) repeat protein
MPKVEIQTGTATGRLRLPTPPSRLTTLSFNLAALIKLSLAGAVIFAEPERTAEPGVSRMTERCDSAKPCEGSLNMSHACRLNQGMILVAFVAMVIYPVAVQSQNSQALAWLRTGLTEKDPQKKIAAYQKAIELDSQLVEAKYNLGLTYKKQQDYRLAEQWFFRAYQTKPEKANAELRLQIALELARTYKRAGKLQACDEVLLGAKELTADLSMQAVILFERGRCQFDQGRYEEALATLREGEKLDRAKAQNFKSFMQLVEEAQEFRRLTEAAQKAVARGDLAQAQILVEQLRQKNPAANLKALAAAVDSLSEAETTRRVHAAMYEQAQKEAAAGKLETAIVTYESLLQKTGDYQDAETRLAAARQQLEQKQIEAKLEEDYTAGQAAMRVRNWPLAILSFEKVLAANPDFRESKKYLDEAKRELETESTETIVARYYAEGLAAVSRNDLGAALAAFEKVQRLNAGYRDVAGLLAEVDHKLRNQAKTALEAAQFSLAQTEALYQEAVRSMQRQQWMEAVVALEKLQMTQPGYRDAASRLAEARANLASAVANGDRSGGAWLYVGGAVCALVLFPVAGFIAFSPAARARLHLLRGNYPEAAQLYEKILQRRPSRVKLYPVLANIYLLMGRQDEQALRIYKMILQLNIATHKRDEINTIVAQNYLTEGRTDSDAISVLENALKAERLKLNQGTY